MTYAIFKAAGQQFRVSPGDSLQVPLLDVEPGKKITFDEVLFTSGGEKIKTGTPMVKGAKVTAEVVEHGRGPKLQIFKFKRRKNYRKKTGHRQGYTQIVIKDVKA
jgi:large subunit ribosomal protein L21